MDNFSVLMDYVSCHIERTEEDKVYYASLLRIKQVKKEKIHCLAGFCVYDNMAGMDHLLLN